MYKKRKENGSLPLTLLSVFEILIINLLTLPFIIFHRSYINLSLWTHEKESYGDEFPVFNWYRGFFDCLIFLCVPLALVIWFLILEFDFSWLFILYLYFLIPSVSLIKEVTLLPLSLTSIIIKKLNDSNNKIIYETEKDNTKKPVMRKKEKKTESFSEKPEDKLNNYPEGHPLNKK